jgi:hypothetical protein
MKYIFLDIDGVVQIDGPVPNEHIKDDMIVVEETYGYILAFRKKAVQLIVDLVKETGAELVLSSSWRLLERDFNIVKSVFAKFGVEIQRKTEAYLILGDHYFNNSIRATEILEFCGINKNNFVVIDDMDMTDWFGERMIFCKDGRGFTKELKDKAKNILTR